MEGKGQRCTKARALKGHTCFESYLKGNEKSFKGAQMKTNITEFSLVDSRSWVALAFVP